MPTKSQHLQIRVTPEQKAALRRAAHGAGLGLSAYVLSQALPAYRLRFAELLQALQNERGRRFALAELNDLLSQLTPGELREAYVEAPPSELPPYWKNYVAAMIEQAAQAKKIAPPDWVRQIEPLAEPHFVTPMKSLRTHLLRASPVPFRRRNIFVDSTVGDRV